MFTVSWRLLFLSIASLVSNRLCYGNLIASGRLGRLLWGYARLAPLSRRDGTHDAATGGSVHITPRRRGATGRATGHLQSLLGFRSIIAGGWSGLQ